MEVGHPPGNPIWMLAMRVATIPFDRVHHALVINLWSGLFMAFAAFFLCRVIFLAVRSYFETLPSRFRLAPFSSDVLTSLIAIGASLCYSLCDSAWFSAVEAEVYAMSAFLTALSLWILMLWWCAESKSAQSRWLILLAYITGLSLGIHQLNLLLIPVFAIIILYKKYPKRVNPALVLLVIIVSVALIGFILLAFIPGILFGAQGFELFAVNSLGLPYNTGVFFFFTLIFLLIIIALIFSYHPLSPVYLPSANMIIWSFSFLVLGFSSFGLIMIRANASPPMNEGSPGDIFALSSYILREQYPSTPLFYGETPYSMPLFEESFIGNHPFYSRYALKKGKGIYQPFMENAALNYRSGMISAIDYDYNQQIIKNQKGYLLSDYKFSHKLTPELDMWFPRITSRNIGHRAAYADWGGMAEESMNRIPVSEVIDSNGKFHSKLNIDGEREPAFSYKPTYTQHLKYFVSYQSYYMYFRYLFWNFIGKQNDFHSNGEIDHGNFITGFPFIDKKMIGNPDYLPAEIWKENKGRNRYFAIPFVLGIIGIIFLLCGNRKQRRYLTLITVLFLMTGLAIVVYLNQSPGEPRERDYSFLGSYMAFAMWIGAGMTALSIFLCRLKYKSALFFLCALISLGTPALMAVENFDDHDRRGRFETTFYASSLLDFEMPAIIFSHGDNSTFPLWYASEVLEMGKDNTPVDITYLSLPSYVANLKKQGNKGINTIAATPDITFGKFLVSRIPPDNISEPQPIRKSLEELYKSEKSTPEWPSSRFILPRSPGDSLIINLHDFTKGSAFLSFKHLMLLDLIASREEDPDSKILYFPSLIDHSFYSPLDSALKPALFGKIYAPSVSDSMAINLLKQSVDRELVKLEKNKFSSHYVDPVISDRSVRYRGELIIAANELLNAGDSVTPVRIIEGIERFYPYSTLPPGTFTIADSTFYEGKEFFNLLSSLHSMTGEPRYKDSMDSLKSLMKKRQQEWVKYFNSLTPSQRKALSTRSKRLLLP